MCLWLDLADAWNDWIGMIMLICVALFHCERATTVPLEVMVMTMAMMVMMMTGWWLDDDWILIGWWLDDDWMIIGWWLDDYWMMIGWLLDDDFLATVLPSCSGTNHLLRNATCGYFLFVRQFLSEKMWRIEINSPPKYDLRMFLICPIIFGYASSSTLHPC